jgi:hypothetical protein
MLLKQKLAAAARTLTRPLLDIEFAVGKEVKARREALSKRLVEWRLLTARNKSEPTEWEYGG